MSKVSSEVMRRYIRGQLGANLKDVTPSVDIPGHVASTLYFYGGLKEFRKKHIDPGELTDVLAVLGIVAEHYASSVRRTNNADPSEPVTESKQLTTQQAATKAQTTTRAITKAINEGRLPAAKHGNNWQINPQDLTNFLKTRNHHGNQADSRII